MIVKPGGVVPRDILAAGVLGLVTSMGAVLGENSSVRIGELGAFMAHLAVGGEGEEGISENVRIVRKGRELLELQKKRSRG